MCIRDRYQREDGTLGVRIPDTVWNAFEEGEKAEDMVIDTPYARQEQILFNDTTDLFRFEADVEFSEGTRSFGLRFYENEETSQS